MSHTRGVNGPSKIMATIIYTVHGNYGPRIYERMQSTVRGSTFRMAVSQTTASANLRFFVFFKRKQNENEAKRNENETKTKRKQNENETNE